MFPALSVTVWTVWPTELTVDERILVTPPTSPPCPSPPVRVLSSVSVSPPSSPAILMVCVFGLEEVYVYVCVMKMVLFEWLCSEEMFCGLVCLCVLNEERMGWWRS